MTKPRILFLYTELAGYFISCLDKLCHEAEVHVVRFPVNKEAPFQFQFNPEISVYEREDYADDQALVAKVDEIDPEVIVCSGWIDKGYLKVIQKRKGMSVNVLALDNHWLGSMKQRLVSLASRATFTRWFDHVWVPGAPQAEYAKKLGFKSILRGFYCADNAKFEAYYRDTEEEKQKHFPKRLLYVGRYVDFKGIRELWEVFISLSDTFPDWELVCAGAGDLWDERVQHPKIKHLGFVQPDEFQQVLSDTGIFVLPSHKEPWGVVVQEYALAGYPMVVADCVGAASLFVQEGENGFLFKTGDSISLKQQLERIMSCSENELKRMSTSSAELGQAITPEKWCNTVLSLTKTGSSCVA